MRRQRSFFSASGMKIGLELKQLPLSARPFSGSGSFAPSFRTFEWQPTIAKSCLSFISQRWQQGALIPDLRACIMTPENGPADSVR